MKLFDLKFFTRLICLIALAVSCTHAVLEVRSLTEQGTIGEGKNISLVTRHISFALLAVLATYIAFRTRSSNGRYLFSLFIALFVLDDSWIYEPLIPWAYHLLYDTLDTLASVIFIAAMQRFPRVVTGEDVSSVFRVKWFRAALTWLLKPRAIVIFGASLFAVLLALSLLHVTVLIAELAVIIIGFSYMYISYRRDGRTGRSSILWLFWAVLLAIFLTLFRVLISLFNPGDHGLIQHVAEIVFDLVLLFGLLMSVFFADTFDTGFIITRTIVDGALFLLVVLIYNVTEHYLLHLLNEHFEINNAFTSSVFSGLMVLLISPLHHKLTHFLNKKFRLGQADGKH